MNFILTSDKLVTLFFANLFMVDITTLVTTECEKIYMVSAILDENKSNMHDDNFPQRVKNAQRNTFVRRNFCMEGHFCMRVNKQKNNKSNKN